MLNDDSGKDGGTMANGSATQRKPKPSKMLNSTGAQDRATGRASDAFAPDHPFNAERVVFGDPRQIPICNAKGKGTKSSSFFVTIVLVTPEVARKWLDFNWDNRHCSDGFVKQYVETMKRDEWVTTTHGVSLGVADGKPVLLDGQTRLAAVVHSGMAVALCVAYYPDEDLSTSAREAFDRGRQRSLCDVATLSGVFKTGEPAKLMIATAICVELAHSGKVQGARAMGLSDVRRLLDEQLIGGHIREVCRSASGIRQFIAPICAALAIARQRDLGAAEAFMDSWKTRMTGNPSDNAYTATAEELRPENMKGTNMSVRLQTMGRVLALLDANERKAAVPTADQVMAAASNLGDVIRIFERFAPILVEDK